MHHLYYPKIFLPFDYDEVLKAKPELPVAPLAPAAVKPLPAYVPPEKPKGLFPAVVAIIVLLLGFILFDSKLLISIGCFLAVILHLYLYTDESAYYPDREKKSKEVYERWKSDYHQQLKKYKDDLRIYEATLEKHSSEVDRLNSSEFLFDYRSSLINNYLKNLPVHSRPPVQSRPGGMTFKDLREAHSKNFFKKGPLSIEAKLKKSFFEFLEQHFGVTNQDKDVQTIVYDFCGSQLALDIKIDVPYCKYTGVIMSSTEDDIALAQKNKSRVLIVFSERQTIKNKQYCVDTIKNTVQQLRELEKITIDYSGKDYAWSLAEAHSMAFSRSRDRYLNESLKE